MPACWAWGRWRCISQCGHVTCQRRPLCPACWLLPARHVLCGVMVELRVPVCARTSWLRSCACAGRRVAGCLAPAVLLLCYTQGVRCHSPVSHQLRFGLSEQQAARPGVVAVATAVAREQCYL